MFWDLVWFVLGIRFLVGMTLISVLIFYLLSLCGNHRNKFYLFPEGGLIFYLDEGSRMCRKGCKMAMQV